jgi:sec-independent protein translocase protein TatC
MPSNHNYSEDLFADTRMTFGEHIEELRTHLISAIKGLVFCMTIGFVLDSIGYAVGKDWIGIGRPMMDIITNPVREQLKAFYDRRMQKLMEDEKSGDKDALKTMAPRQVRLGLSPQAVARLLGKPIPVEGTGETLWIDTLIPPADIYEAQKEVANVVRPPDMAAMNVTEPMMVYFKVSFLCGLVLASPWVFWQIWSFIAAGLYPHEKRLVNVYLPISLGLFLVGVFMCQFAIIPRSIEALLWFNEWLGIAPELRLNEWLSFAIMLPLVFGVAFQTPLVMMFVAKIGIVSSEGFQRQWRIWIFAMAVFAAVITPTPDVVTWGAMFAPMVGLYVLGIYLCKLVERANPDIDVPESDELVEV